MAHTDNLTIMFVDMAAFAERTSRQSREQNKAMLRTFNGLLVPLIARFGGHRVKSIGDALLVTFRSPTDSVRCGMAMHDAVAHHNQRTATREPIVIRVALNAGEVRLDHADVFGEAVNIAARVEELTPPGEIYLTGVVYLSMNKAEVPAEHVGEYALKGVPEPVRIFRAPPHKLNRLTPAGEPLDAGPGELPYGGMHALPPDSAVLARLADALRRAPYVDWSAKVRELPRRKVLAGSAILLAAAFAVGAFVSTRPEPGPTAPARAGIGAAARETLNTARTAYHEGRRADAAALYAKALELEPTLRHDSGLAANLVGSLSWGGESAVQTIRKYPSPELIYELARRTAQPGRKGAQRAATLLTELGQADRIDRRGLAVTELSEAPACEERLAAVRTLRKLRDPRTLPALRESVRRNVSTLFGEDKNRCLRAEAEKAIAELEKSAPR